MIANMPRQRPDRFGAARPRASVNRFPHPDPAITAGPMASRMWWSILPNENWRFEPKISSTDANTDTVGTKNPSNNNKKQTTSARLSAHKNPYDGQPESRSAGLRSGGSNSSCGVFAIHVNVGRPITNKTNTQYNTRMNPSCSSLTKYSRSSQDWARSKRPPARGVPAVGDAAPVVESPAVTGG